MRPGQVACPVASSIDRYGGPAPGHSTDSETVAADAHGATACFAPSGQQSRQPAQLKGHAGYGRTLQLKAVNTTCHTTKRRPPGQGQGWQTS